LDRPIAAPERPVEHDEDATHPAKRKRVETHHLAWAVLGTFFGIFCTLCLTTSFGVYYFMFQSNVRMTAVVEVARGTVGIVGADLSQRFEFDRAVVTRDDTVLTDAQSQSQVVFQDSQQPGRVVAAVTLKNDSGLVVRQITQPRFDWSRSVYRIVLDGVRGEFDVFVSDSSVGGQQQTDITLNLPHETRVVLNESGNYTVTIGEEQIQVRSRRGAALLVPPERAGGRTVIAGQTGIFNVRTDSVAMTANYEELIANNIFSLPPAEVSELEAGTANAFDLWNCTDRTYTEVPGYLEWSVFQGRLSLHVQRLETSAPGQTGCIQPMGYSAQSGRTVANYDYLSLRASFLVETHSLDACGVEGSECPVMLRLDYIDAEGDDHRWYQGFYAKNNPLTEYPLRCNSPGCEEHKRVNTGTWYTYESGNLFSLFPVDRQPKSILNVQFYSSGHEYDVYMSEISLTAAPAQARNDGAASP
jgi:hypothetical protein